MPRGPRLDQPGLTQHVMVRGIERRSIFLDDEDRRRFLLRLERVLADTGTRCFAFALMPNHYHLLLEPLTVSLSRVLHRLGTGHAVVFNRRHDRCGHLYQNRFKSIPVEDDAYFLTVLRYIHLNPVHARMVSDLQALGTWPWTGHAALVGNVAAPFLDIRKVLASFGEDPTTARRRLGEWMALGLGDPGHPEREEANVGDPLPPNGEATHRDPGLLDRFSQRSALRLAGWDLDRVIATACDRLGIEEPLLRAGRRTVPACRAREVVAWAAVERLGLSRADVARATGVSHQAVTRSLERAGTCMDRLRSLFPELVA